MDITTAKTLSAKLQISQDYIIREEYEIILLKDIFESGIGSHLVFKGGTALRLAYGSPRFSEDLDFTLIANFSPTKLTRILKKTAGRFSSIKSVETVNKFNTLLTLIKIKEEHLPQPFSIKIEISKRKSGWKKEEDYSEKIIRSETSPLTVLALVANLETVLREKQDAIKNRKAPRDLFDFWYINQLLKKEVEPNFSGFDKILVKSELRKLLPKNYWSLVEQWLG